MDTYLAHLPVTTGAAVFMPRPAITVTVGWALQVTYLSICLLRWWQWYVWSVLHC